jgi:hypothetical protein
VEASSTNQPDQVMKRGMDNDPREFYELVDEAKLHQVSDNKGVWQTP